MCSRRSVRRIHGTEENSADSRIKFSFAAFTFHALVWTSVFVCWHKFSPIFQGCYNERTKMNIFPLNFSFSCGYSKLKTFRLDGRYPTHITCCNLFIAPSFIHTVHCILFQYEFRELQRRAFLKNSWYFLRFTLAFRKKYGGWHCTFREHGFAF